MKLTRPPARAAATAWLAPLPPGGGHELSAQDGLAGPRDAVELDDHVGVGTADDDNRILCH